MLESITITFTLLWELFTVMVLPLLTVTLPLLAVVLLGRWLRKRYLYKTPARDDSHN
jgi:hypothetical protein